MKSGRGGVWVWIGLGALWLISGSAWIVGQFWTSPLAPLPRIAFDNAVLALVLGAAALVRLLRKGQEQPPVEAAARQLWGAVAWGFALFAVPGLIAAGARGHVEQFTSALMYMIVPTAVILVMAQRTAGFGAQEPPLAAMVPALAGVAGAAFLLPFVMPSTVDGLFWLAAVIVGVALGAVAAVKLYGCLRGLSPLSVAALIALAAAITAGLTMGRERSSLSDLVGWDLTIEIAVALIFNALTLLLSVWLLARVAAIPFASRYYGILCVTISEGLILLKPEVTWTTPAGLALMAFACWRLLLIKDQSVA